MKTLILILAFTIAKGQKIGDDVKHFYASVALTHTFGQIAYHKTNKPGLSCLIGMGSSLVIGTAKEYIWDKRLKKGVFSKDDLFMNAWGTLCGGMTLRIVIDIKERK